MKQLFSFFIEHLSKALQHKVHVATHFWEAVRIINRDHMCNHLLVESKVWVGGSKWWVSTRSMFVFLSIRFGSISKTSVHKGQLR